MYHISPPCVFEVFLEFDTQRAEVEKSVIASVDFGRLENEPAAFAEGYDGVHERVLRVFGFRHKGYLNGKVSAKGQVLGAGREGCGVK